MSRAKSFRAKLWLYFALFAAVILSLLWLLQTVFFQSFYDGMLEGNTRAAAEEIASSSESANIADVIDRLSLDNSLLVFVTDADGAVVYSSDSYKSYYQSSDHGDGGNNPYLQGKTLDWQSSSYRNLPDGYDDFLSALKSSSDGKAEISTDTQYECGSYINLVDGSQAVLYVSVTLGGAGAAVSIIRIQLIWVTILSLLIAFVIAWFLARKFSVPVRQLSTQAKMLATDDYAPAFEKGFCMELDGLAQSLDETAKELSEAKGYQKELLANVSHDLRTPLTMIKGYAEMIRDVSGDDETARNADVGIIIQEADRMDALVNEILAYSKLQEKTADVQFDTVDISALIGNVIRRFEPLAQRQGIAIDQTVADGCLVIGNENLLERMAYNLVGNALHHAGECKRIAVALRREGSGILFEVLDHGEGIDEAELPHIWEKYYTSRQRGNKGVSGLGLAIVLQIAELHDAQCGVESKKGAGSRFWVRLKSDGPNADIRAIA